MFFFIVMAYFWLFQILLGLILECFGLFLVVLARLGSLQVVFVVLVQWGSLGLCWVVLACFRSCWINLGIIFELWLALARLG